MLVLTVTCFGGFRTLGSSLIKCKCPWRIQNFGIISDSVCIFVYDYDAFNTEIVFSLEFELVPTDSRRLTIVAEYFSELVLSSMIEASRSTHYIDDLLLYAPFNIQLLGIWSSFSH